MKSKPLDIAHRACAVFLLLGCEAKPSKLKTPTVRAFVVSSFLWITFVPTVALGANALGVDTLSILDFGAKGDGKNLCTSAIQQAIDAAAKAGGGVVTCPPGTWLTGTIFLKSHVTLRLQQGCTLLGSTNINDYPERIPAIRSYTDNYTRRSLIYAEGIDDIAIEGAGTLDGNGGLFPRKAGPKVDYLRPYLLRVINCRDVRVEGIFLKNSAMWTHHYFACERVRVTGVRVWAFANYNNDGIDIDGCRDVVVSKCFMASEDDGITLKSTSEHPCQSIVISDCAVSSRSSCIKLGTESMGGFRDVTIVNCTVNKVPSDAPKIFGDGRNGLVGIDLISADGGCLERVNISNVTIDGMLVPIGLRLGARGRGLVDSQRVPESQRPARLPVGTFKDVSLANIVATGGGRNCGILLLGHPGHPLQNVSLANITVRGKGGGEAKLADRPVPERAYDYPQPVSWGNLPGYGLYARHVRGLTVSNVRLQTAAPDARHGLVFDDVEDADLSGVACMPGKGTNAFLRLSTTRNVLVHGSQPRSSEGVFLKVDGSDSSGIVLLDNDFSQVKRVVETASDVPLNALRQAGNLGPLSAQ